MATDLETKIREALRGDDFVGLPTTAESEDATEE
jgi:hypothetical protein